MTFTVPPSKRSKEQDTFTFKIGTKTYKTTRLKFQPVGLRAAAVDDGEVALDMFGAKGTPAGDAVRSLDQDQFAALTKAFEADSDVTLGESKASAT